MSKTSNHAVAKLASVGGGRSPERHALAEAMTARERIEDSLKRAIAGRERALLMIEKAEAEVKRVSEVLKVAQRQHVALVRHAAESGEDPPSGFRAETSSIGGGRRCGPVASRLFGI